jgi:transposase
MPGRFNGLSDGAWEILSELLPPEPEKRGKGMPHADFRKVLNTIFYILITGCRWCDIPENRKIFASKSSSHRWLVIWQEEEVLDKIRRSIIELADLNGLIDWSKSAVDGSFSPWQGRRSGG